MNPFQNIPNSTYISTLLGDNYPIVLRKDQDGRIKITIIDKTKEDPTDARKFYVLRDIRHLNLSAEEFITTYKIDTGRYRFATNEGGDLPERATIVNDPRLVEQQAPAASSDDDVRSIVNDMINRATRPVSSSDDNAVQHNAPNRNARNNSVNVRRGKMANQPVYVLNDANQYVQKIDGKISRKILQLAHSKVNADAHRYPDGTFNRKTYMDTVTAERERLTKGWYNGDAQIKAAINAVELKEKKKSAYRQCWDYDETKQNVRDAVRAVRKQVRTSMCGHLKDQNNNMMAHQRKIETARSHFNNPYGTFDLNAVPRPAQQLANLRPEQLQQLQQLAGVLFPGN